MKRFICCILCALLLVGCSSTVDGQVKLSFINIGKGDCFLIEMPNQTHYLIDTGKAQDFPQIARALKMNHVDMLDGIILSHGHKDHVGGLDALLDCFETKAVYVSDADTVSYTNFDMNEITAKHHVDLVRVKSGYRIEQAGASIDFWIPKHVDRHEANNNSIINQIEFGENRMLMMGDAQLEEEAAYLNEHMNLRSDVLKMGHHGKKDATSIKLLEKTKPKYALITSSMEEDDESFNEVIAKRLETFHVQSYASQGNQLSYDFYMDGNNVRVQEVYDEQKILASIQIESVDVEEQRCVLTNITDQEFDLSNCILFSTKDDEHFKIPEGTIVQPGECISIVCKGHVRKDSDIVWPQELVWTKDKKEIAQLYDSDFKLMDEEKISWKN